MKRLVLLCLASLGLFAAGPVRQEPSMKTTEEMDFAPGGTVRVDGSFGCLSVEGWDRPEVEVTVTRFKAGFYSDKERQAWDRKLAGVQVRTSRRSATELVISTHRPKRRHWFSPALPADVEYQIRVPRATHLVIRHGGGEVFIADVSGGIEATSDSGDIVAMLPNPGPYSIDAKVSAGTIYTDFGDARHQHVIGERFADAKPAPAPRVFLRTGIGGISIQETNPGGY